MPDPSPFHVRDCTSAIIATGIKAQNLAEFRDRLLTIAPACIDFHFWGARLRVTFEHREFHNDFAHWAHHNLHDDFLAERLEMVDPKDYENLERLRSDVLEIVENRLDERESTVWFPYIEQFHFMRSKLLVFDTRHWINEPSELVKVFPQLTRSSLFYHMIDARRRIPDKQDDFTVWLKGFGDSFQPLIDEFMKIDPYFISLADLQRKLISIATDYFVRKEIEAKQP